jgi:HlyD family type I secretion membrane fusion protein
MQQTNEQQTSTPVTLRSITAERFRTDQLNGWAAAVPFGQRRLRVIAALVLVGVFGFGGYWASTAHLGGAAVGVGRVIATGSNRIVQHLEGGILSRVLVNQGDIVSVGTPLGELDTTAIVSQLTATQIQRATLAAQLARWRAAIDGIDSFSVDPEQLAPMHDNPRVVEAVKSQQGAFAATLAVERKQLSMLDAKIDAARNDIDSQKATIVALNEQDSLIKMEHSDLNKLLTSGLTGKSRVLALERTMAQISAQRSIAEFTIAKGESDIRALSEEKDRTSLQYAEDANKNFAIVQRDMNSTEDIEARLKDRLARSVIRSPADGVVFRVYKRTEGSVLGPGESFVEIFPDREAMSVEVVVQPKDITSVHKGQTVDVVFQSDHRAKLIPIEGTVDYISTDTIVNEQSGRAMYIVRASINKGQDERRVLPGNTAEVYFQTEPKTLVQLLAEPLTRFAFKAFTG